MPTTPVNYPHLVFSKEGWPVVERVNFKAIQLIREHLAYGWSAEELALNHPQLRLGEIYAVLAWHADHAEEIREAVSESLDRANIEASKPEMRYLSHRLRSSDGSR